MPSRPLLASAAALALAIVNLASTDIIYVDDSAVGANDGSSWANAFRKLRPALAVAQSGDIVRIAQGVYVPANAGGPRSATFDVRDGVRVVGGYAGDGAVDPDAFDPDTFVTILTGDLNEDDGPDFANDGENSWHVVTFRDTNGGTVLRGVTVTGGNADSTPTLGEDDAEGAGGGIACIVATVTFRDCIIQGWTGGAGGLGGSHNNGDDPLLIDADGADDTFGTVDDDPRLGVGSPAINSGRNDLLPRDDFDLDGDGNFLERISEDLDCDRRIRQGVVDRGAFEVQPQNLISREN